jgi:hypothetical protein
MSSLYKIVFCDACPNVPTAAMLVLGCSVLGDLFTSVSSCRSHRSGDRSMTRTGTYRWMPIITSRKQKKEQRQDDPAFQQTKLTRRPHPNQPTSSHQPHLPNAATTPPINLIFHFFLTRPMSTNPIILLLYFSCSLATIVPRFN